MADATLRAATARQVALLEWRQALADEARAARNRRGRRPVPAITGIRIPAPKEQP